jgi:futalosine hydrolase
LVLIAAAPAEARAIAAGLVEAGFDRPSDAFADAQSDWAPVRFARDLYLLQSGVGKVNAACAAMIAFRDLRPCITINLGICGVLPSTPGSSEPSPQLLDSILASASVYADEGLLGPTGFQTIAQMGFPQGPFPDPVVPITAGLSELLRPLADHVAPIATVSTCSGTDHMALEVARRTGALAEAMEGAAIAHAVAKHNALTLTTHAASQGRTLPCPTAFAELRVISNTTGDRDRQRWDIRGALVRLTDLSRRLVEA